MLQADWDVLAPAPQVRKRQTPARWSSADERGLRARMAALDSGPAARRLSSTRRAARDGEVRLADGRVFGRDELPEGSHRLEGGGVVNRGELAVRRFLGDVRIARADGRRDHLRGRSRWGRAAARAGALERLVERRGLSRVLEDLADRDPVTLAAIKSDPAAARLLAQALGA
jgi:hypothetical protein